MRVSRFVSILAGFAVALAVPLLPAQTAGGASSLRIGSGADGSDAAQAKLPYTASWTLTSVQTLADGTTITRVTTTKFARDASGRTYNETHSQLPLGPDGRQREFVFYFVHDPVAHTDMSWSSAGKQVLVFHRPAQATVAPSVTPTVRLPNLPQDSASQAGTQQAGAPNPNFQREELGTKNVAGINAKGVRITRILPAGEIGNDQPITEVKETWRSPEYGLILMSINDDPRMGKTTREVTDFEPGDPDPSLFQAPQGYSVRDRTPHGSSAVAVQ